MVVLLAAFRDVECKYCSFCEDSRVDDAASIMLVQYTLLDLAKTIYVDVQQELP